MEPHHQNPQNHLAVTWGVSHPGGYPNPGAGGGRAATGGPGKREPTMPPHPSSPPAWPVTGRAILGARRGSAARLARRRAEGGVLWWSTWLRCVLGHPVRFVPFVDTMTVEHPDSSLSGMRCGIQIRPKRIQTRRNTNETACFRLITNLFSAGRARSQARGRSRADRRIRSRSASREQPLGPGHLAPKAGRAVARSSRRTPERGLLVGAAIPAADDHREYALVQTAGLERSPAGRASAGLPRRRSSCQASRVVRERALIGAG